MGDVGPDDGKSDRALRTIGEVANHLGLQPHVLRFWESKFNQIRPLKRASGRRFYRPGDVSLLAGVRHLLREKGMTIRGVQKLMRTCGVDHVRALADGEAASPDSHGALAAELDAVRRDLRRACKLLRDGGGNEEGSEK